MFASKAKQRESVFLTSRSIWTIVKAIPSEDDSINVDPVDGEIHGKVMRGRRMDEICGRWRAESAAMVISRPRPSHKSAMSLVVAWYM